jgi:hypothetical protein
MQQTYNAQFPRGNWAFLFFEIITFLYELRQYK